MSCRHEKADKTANIVTRPKSSITDIPVNGIQISIEQKINTVWQNNRDSIATSNKFKKVAHSSKHVSKLL